MAVTCIRCGLESESDKTFFQHKKFLSRTVEFLCPACTTRKAHKELKSAILIHCLWIVVATALVLLFPRYNFGWLLLNAYAFSIASTLCILPHELGHAFAARSLGFRVFSVKVGDGRTAWRGKMFGFDVFVNSFPTGGSAQSLPRNPERFRLRYFGVIASGPLVNVLIVLLLCALVPAKNLWLLSALSRHFEPLTMLLYANLWVLAVNLWPQTFNGPLGELGTDGKELLTILSLKQDAIDTRRAAYFSMEGSQQLAIGNLDAAEEWVNRGLAIYPGHRVLLVDKALCLLQRGRYSDGRDILVSLLSSSDNTPQERVILMHNIADADLLLADDTLVPEADHYSQEAMVMLGAVPEIQATRGNVLCALGRFEEGLPLLEFAFQNVEEIRVRGEIACDLTIFESHRGNRTIAAEYLAAAKTLYPKCHLIPRAEAALAGVSMKTVA